MEPWISFGEWRIEGVTVEWELGARVAQNHTSKLGVRLSKGAKLVRPFLTSTVYNRKNMIGLDPVTAKSEYSHGCRSIFVEGDNAEILDIQMLEFMAGGITQISGSGLKVTGLTARHLRSAEGWAAAINLGKDVRGAYISVAHISDCDRALEPEDGCQNVLFVPQPGILERIWSRWYDIAENKKAEGFCISAHSHYYSTACKNLHFSGTWSCVDCVTPILIDKSTADSQQMPKNIRVDHVEIVNTKNFPKDLNVRPQVWIEGDNCHVSVSFSHPDGKIESVARVQVNNGIGNSVTLPGPDINAAVPWVNVMDKAVDTVTNVNATALSVQPTPPSDTHIPLVNVEGKRSIVTGSFHGVQHRGYVNLGSAKSPANGSVVSGVSFIMPASNGPDAAVRFQGSVDCAIRDSSFQDPSGKSLLARVVSGSLNSEISGNRIALTGKDAVVVEDGAAGTKISDNEIIQP